MNLTTSADLKISPWLLRNDHLVDISSLTAQHIQSDEMQLEKKKEELVN